MKKLMLALALLSTGCLVSVHSAWSPSDVVEMKKLAGIWHVHTYGGNQPSDLPRTPWIFQPVSVDAGERSVPGFTIDVVDDEDRGARLEGVFFKLGKETYFESTVDRAPMNNLAALYMVSYRLLVRVEVKRGELRFFGLDDEALKKDGVALEQPGANGVRLNTMPAKDWRSYVQKRGKALFLAEPTIVIKRRPS